MRGVWSGRDERGAVAVLVAFCLLVLIGFAAIAVDSGIVYGDRRQQQSAADVGALAALQFAKTGLPSGHPACTGLTGKARSACRGAEEALAVIDGTLPGRYANADWSACVDANKPAEYNIASAISSCISFTNSMRRARVALPGTDVDTSFGAVLGVNSVSVGAFAEAGVEIDISGGVLPFALGPSGAGSNQACFFTQDTGTLNIPPCTGSTSGNFGKLDVRWYGNELYGPPTPECTGQNAWRMSMNIITGTDHIMEITSDTPGIVNDVSNCNNITNPVDQVQTWTGNAAGAIGDGLINGISSPTAYEGRLRCKDGDAAENYPAFAYTSTGSLDSCVMVNNTHAEALDHTPLWEFIAPGANSEVIGGACAPGGGAVKNRAEMEACLAGWRAWGSPHTQSLFTSDIVESPRFGAVPQLNADPGGGSGSYLITGFKPVYLETLYLKCNANSCDTVHSPGENTDASPPAACPTPLTSATTSCGWIGNGNKSIEAITSFILTLDMLPGDVSENFPFTPGTVIYNLYR